MIVSINFILNIILNLKLFLFYFKNIVLTTFRDGFLYLRGLFIIFFIDSCVTDDEPLWEPIEWSLVQTWLLFIFFFSWVVENLICSRYGAYTGRDKRVWFSLYKWFWLFEGFWMGSLLVACLFILVPFYYEITYSISSIVTWWNWYNSLFFFKFISIYVIILFLGLIIQINTRWVNWKKIFFLSFFILLILNYIFFSHFIYVFFLYFTNTNSYNILNWIDYANLSVGPNHWHWGPSSRDHFTYHKSLTVFWVKNDIPFLGAFLFIHLLFFLFLFFLVLKWFIFFRRIWTTKDVTYNSVTFNTSSLRQFFYYFLLFFIFTFMSFINQYYRFPVELLPFKFKSEVFNSFLNIIFDLIW